jgi:iron complex outermembrane recepter protein
MRTLSVNALAIVAALTAAPARAQTSTAAGSTNAVSQSGQSAPAKITLPPVTVTAQKEPADPKTLPVSVTTVPADLLEKSGVTMVSEAGAFAPNASFTEFTARKLSNARMRGLGAGPANPGVTTYFDGVPQFNASSSSTELLDISQIEFVRGPQSTLFGRNALGGLINIATARPSLSKWTGTASVPFGDHGQHEFRAGASGPLAQGKAAAGFSMSFAERDGFTVNDLNGQDVDSRSAFAAKGQVLWKPSSLWETRVIVSGERARDGDYALNDLAAVRSNPFHVSRDYEGRTDRDIFSTTILARREGNRFTVSSTTGFVKWDTFDSTDLDYSPLPLATRNNNEEDFQFTQEVRLASAAASPAKLSDAMSLRWQSGLFLFTQSYEQLVLQNFSAFVIPQVPFAVQNTSPDAALDDFGVGVYGQGTLSFKNRVDVSFGARLDHESKDADIATSTQPAIAPPTQVSASRSFTDVSPQVGVSFHITPETMAYVSVNRGYKAGGFNPTAPPGSEAYGEEGAWHIEGGVKTTAAAGRVSFSASAFSIDWNDLQLNVPVPFAPPGTFYISNVADAASRGVEFEVTARPHADVDLFASFGATHARFGAGSQSAGVDVSDNKIQFTPDYTAAIGAQFSKAIKSAWRMYGRMDVLFTGAFEYDDANTTGQDAYALTNFRAGVRGKVIFADVWVKNAFDTSYIPVAIPYPGFAPSGFVGEPGRPRTFGVSLGVGF